MAPYGNKGLTMGKNWLKPITPYEQYLQNQTPYWRTKNIALTTQIGPKDLNFKVDQTSGTMEDEGGPDTFKVVGDTQMPNLRPVVDIVNYLTANREINQVEKEQLARKNMYYNAPSLSVRPVQDLSPEILAAQADARSQMRSEYAGSDPTMNLLSKNVATAARGKMYNEQIAGRAGQIATERNRFDEQTRGNQQAAAETANKNLEKAQDFADYRTGVKTAALDAKSKLNASFLSQLGMNMDTAAQFNMSVEALNVENQRTQYSDLLKRAAMEPEGLRREELLAEADKLYKQYTVSPLSTYGRAQAMALKPRLSPRFAKLSTL
jgi:hypothetical protein